MSHTIRFKRPETPYSVSRMFVPTAANTAAQIRHLEGLGYTIVDVSPALAGYVLSETPSVSEPMS